MRMANCIVMYGCGNWGRVQCGYFTNSRLLKCEMAQSRWGAQVCCPQILPDMAESFSLQGEADNGTHDKR